MNKILISLALMAVSAVADAAGLVAVYVQENQIAFVAEGRQPVRLTNTPGNKRCPVMSKDGSMIAYLTDTDKAIALDKIVVINSSGLPVSSILVRPVSADDSVPVNLMRFVERIEWLSNATISVSGSINPTTYESALYDIATGKELDKNPLSDGVFTAFSPDGNHYASVSGAPHFSPPTSKSIFLVIDGNRAFPPVESAAAVRFASDAVWSDDSSSLAIVSQNILTGVRGLFIWRANGRTTNLPLDNDQITPNLKWVGSTLYVRMGVKVFQVLDSTTQLLTSVLASLFPDNSLIDARVKSMESSIRKSGGSEVTFWCDGCALSIYPRQATDRGR